MALERAETVYERLMWQQGQLELAKKVLAGKAGGYALAHGGGGPGDVQHAANAVRCGGSVKMRACV